ncbi:MAG: NAD-dependent epimerase/dehydratase family protein [Planctomycetes bacterium]|nr:NAD-dependent epimerase/dehydratase family protein [Planctomycetota bacterium]
MRVAITGSSGFIGSRLIAHLAQDADVEAILGLDVTPPREPQPKLTFVQQDVTKAMEPAFREHRIDAAVHLAFIVDPMHDEARMTEINLQGTESFLAACDALGVKTIVAASSATAYGGHPDNAVPLVEDRHPLRGNPEYLYSHQKMRMERMFEAFGAKHPDARVGLLRPSIVLGPHVSNFISRMVRNRVMFAVLGADTPWQFTHEEDAGRAFHHALKHRIHGAYNIGGAGSIQFSEIGKLAGNLILRFPAWMLKPAIALGWLFRLRSLTEAPAGILPMIQWPWVVDPSKFVRETGFVYQYDTRGALRTFLESAGLTARAEGASNSDSSKSGGPVAGAGPGAGAGAGAGEGANAGRALQPSTGR